MRQNAQRAFLELIGLEGDELETFLPDWLAAAEFLGLTDDDVSRAINEWIPIYWDLTYAGVRECIAACVREVAEAAKMGDYKRAGKKVLYSNMPASPVCIYANKLAGAGELHISHPDFLMATILSAFFNKDSADIYGEASMNPACRHCAMNCLRADASRDGVISPPTVTWNWGLNCNEAPKTEEMIRCMRGPEWNDVFITIPHDAPLGDVESADRERVDYLAREIRDGQRQVTEYTRIAVTPEHLNAAMAEYMGYMRRVERLTNLVVKADPQPMSGNDLTLFSICTEVSFDTGFKYLNHALDTAIAEVEERISRHMGILPAGAPKLACYFNPLNVPWVDKTFRDNGVNLSIGRLFPPASFLERHLDGGDIYSSIARQCLSTPSVVNMRNEADIVTEVLSQYEVDGALYGFYDFDRWIGALQKTMIQIVEKRTNIPHFYLEGDFWNVGRNSLPDRITIIRSICNCLKILGIT